ncbi:MAG: transport protein, partial [Devosia sp.]|uniref:AEC family transporter n=1 Tax=Devosia sp. TaxID=1871048 RepID=UPI00260D7912
RFVFHLSIGMSALAALAASAPNLAFLGPTVLGYLYGASSNGPVALGNIINFVTVIPATLILLSIDSQPVAGPDGAKPQPVSVGSKIVQALRQPVVWMPVLGVVVVLLGVTVPPPLDSALALLGQASAGVALFVSGIVLASNKVTVSGPVLLLVIAKNIIQPGLVIIALLLLGYGNPVLSEAVVAISVPSQVLIAMLALQYKIAPVEFASVLALTTVGSLVTMSAFIALTGG